MIVISDEAEKFGGIQHFGPMEIIWLLHMLRYPIDEPRQKLVFDSKTRYYRVIGNLNSEQLFWACIRSENPKLKHSGLQISVTFYTIPF